MKNLLYEDYFIGKQYAMEEIRKSLTNKNIKAFYDTLIKDKETAISIAKPILFGVYGKENIIRQKPYEYKWDA